ncbi:D-tagatose-bisphosphate aldolase, class II, non-catalytic subunit [Paraburkholderia megapolitana]|uniref:Tagatose-bisphosphate aldolase noncatalytic subunit n=1 Tax=Paraburkholderia megapolitana TaxID=420953 RepID=A0A1I3IUD1_9BURK|nr:D-tagatose-bisphosphate aldolase, class II, non-catalytic subunit [Paraburkholderia megapolitana]QDQ85046.1 D-tagatose-bisphosphate aldolase, class II, non-catalytic subunit [Paraburkholderia megapolitana]SFI51558.1 tagatose-bisphosphate aldolase noncatalytic subunit [Paraburkholderia megapolitana]
MTNVVFRLSGDERAAQKLKGMYSICSAHPWVLGAAMKQALDDDTPLLIESTSNQVDQFGGYTGMKPADFVRFVHLIADRVGLPRSRLILGGDHLGPNAWRDLPAEEAMQHAEALIDAYVSAGFAKIHLDTSMSCAGDPERLSDHVVAGRASRLCAIAEAAAARAGRNGKPVYVIGTEVPVPGGAAEELEAVEVTHPEAAFATVAVHRQAWRDRGLDDVWERVIALVVQPGVEFDHTKVVDYQPRLARKLAGVLEQLPGMVFEAHSTDYQRPESLATLVWDGFAILKVGPGVTFALREALYALADIETELVSPETTSNLREVVERVMLSRPGNWEKYYHGDEQKKRLLRTYSYSDRVRYYWADPEIDAAVQTLMSNLAGIAIPENLLSRHLPEQYWQFRREMIDASPMSLIESKVREVIGSYAAACRICDAASEET